MKVIGTKSFSSQLHSPPSTVGKIQSSKLLSSSLSSSIALESCLVLYPKIFPPIFFKIWQDQASNGLRIAQCKHPPNTVKIRVLVLPRNLGFSMAQSSPIGPYTLSSTYMPSFKVHSIKWHSQKLHLLHNQLQGQNDHFTVKSKKFWSTSYFEATIII